MTEIVGIYHADGFVSVVYWNYSEPEQYTKARELSQKKYL